MPLPPQKRALPHRANGHVVNALPGQHPRDSRRAVAIGIRLDHGHEQGTPHPQRAQIVPQMFGAHSDRNGA